MQFQNQEESKGLGSDYIYIDKSPHGSGIFTRKNIKKGELIFSFTGNFISFSDCVALGPGEAYTIQVDTIRYLQPLSPGRYINHSCDPNCGITGELYLVALKGIDACKELTFDYSTTMLERYWEMDCGCGSENCRSKIMDFDTLPANRQAYYINHGVVQPFILEWMEKRGKHSMEN